MARTPSLRDLRRECAANVVILATAQARKVQQQYGRAFAKAKRELVATQAVAFPYVPPWTRAYEKAEQSLELRADVPPFDPGNGAHLRAWEALWDMRRKPSKSDSE